MQLGLNTLPYLLQLFPSRCHEGAWQRHSFLGRLPHGVGVARLFDAPVGWSRQHQMLGLAHCISAPGSARLESITNSAFKSRDAHARVGLNGHEGERNREGQAGHGPVVLLKFPVPTKTFPVTPKKFPVPLRREFACKLLSLLA
jgi:hypothetical protein